MNFSYILIFLFFQNSIYSQDIGLRELVIVENKVFKVWYNEIYEQPIKLKYKSIDNVKKADRKSMDFYKVDSIHTSDDKDYYKNIWDKGHLAPAASFSDTKENLKITFSYLNCSLQNQYLNRGQWRLLEAQERVWDDNENLDVTVELIFEEKHIILPTGAHVPTSMVKHIFFEKQRIWKCFEFKNMKLQKKWNNYEVNHSH
jgi:DNA/RNA endonuclease G (NUC1)